ncbi:mechanosensitive ion channel family protein [Nitrosomonas supralitoralis]|uniref:Small-conductance mechanosensitive channel n=1 Tax=Nitrosomonas supralitoralis TaxID=2116706 RepID=A0A2P7NZE9_9PROT|nr:mechanosensitive ion channel family protein [Nitrosomonas supralitoralis]PSJ18824.1 mechanosensitive ion channel protein MscS [Nitrosomonas supralitoralis]
MHKLLTISVICTLLISISVYADQISDLITGETTPESAPKTEKVIEVNSSVHDDKKIQKRLEKIFSELENLQSIKVMVSNGIVTLRGDVSTSSTKNKALQLSQQVAGVVEVENELKVTHHLKTRLEDTWKKFSGTANELIASLPLVLLAILVFVLSWMLGGWISGRRNFFRKIASNPFIANLLGQVTHLLFILMGLIIALSLLDLTAILGTLLGAAGIVGLAVGFAVRDTVENYLASILLSLRNPFEVNDLVNIDGNEGHVVRLTTRATILISQDGNHIRIPNSTVFKAVIINFTRNVERRFQFDVGIDTEQNLLEAQALALQTLGSVKGILSEPKPLVTIEELGDSSIKLRIYGWIDQTNFSFLKVRSEAIRQTKQAFDQANIIMPEPIYQVRVLNETNNLLKQESRTRQNYTPRTDSQINVPVHEVTDTSTDNEIEKKVAEEQSQSDTENLLNKKSALE